MARTKALSFMSKSVYCLGNCALSPAALLDGEPIGRLDRDRIDAIVAGAQGKTQ